MKETLDVAKKNAAKGGGSFTVTHDMREAFKGADIVYPKSWASHAAMEKRTDFYGKGDMAGIKELEKELLAQNATHKDWEAPRHRKKRKTAALYMHCLRRHLGVSCKEGEPPPSSIVTGTCCTERRATSRISSRP
jgi:ornithine carbamoyltransferase